MKAIRLIVILLAIMLSATLSVAGAQNTATNGHLSIELITIGPGPFYWEAFGHSALRIKNDNQDYMFGFGYFDFEEEDFFLKFAKGEMQYFLGAEQTEYELQKYQQQGRQIWSQTLNLSSGQKNTLVTRLNHLLKPENRYYHYDYFLDNCTSRIRDLLDEVTDNDISQTFTNIKSPVSWSGRTFPVVNQSWMNLGIALGYGLPAYKSRNKWSLDVFPVDFAESLGQLSTQTGWNQPPQIVFEPTVQQSMFKQYDFLKTHYAMLLIVVLVLIFFFMRITRSFTMKFWLIAQSIVGCLLLMLWFLTEHSVAKYNVNIMLFLPCAFLLVSKRFVNGKTVWLFLMVNCVWLLCAIFITDWYLMGFFLINIMVFLKLKKEYLDLKSAQ